GHLLEHLAGSLYSEEGSDPFALGKLDPGNQVVVGSRTITGSSLTYKVQVVGKNAGLLADGDNSQLDNKATVSSTTSDDYYLKIEAVSGVGLRGQYLVDIDVQDTASPRITAISGIPAEGG